MAYIPDRAIDEAFEVSTIAFKLYAYICRRRNHQKQFAWLTNENVQSALSISRSTAYEATKELIHKNWLRCEDFCWYPIKGDFTPVDRRWQKG